jgi:symplekin
MPAHFTASFTPIEMAGTESQIRHVSRILAAQITAFQLGPEAALQAGFNVCNVK